MVARPTGLVGSSNQDYFSRSSILAYFSSTCWITMAYAMMSINYENGTTNSRGVGEVRGMFLRITASAGSCGWRWLHGCITTTPHMTVFLYS